MEEQESHFSSSFLSKNVSLLMKTFSCERFKLSSLAIKVYGSKLYYFKLEGACLGI